MEMVHMDLNFLNMLKKFSNNLTKSIGAIVTYLVDKYIEQMDFL